MKTCCYAALTAKSALVPYEIERRKLGPNDVGIDISYVGLCHSDIDMVYEDWRKGTFPMVPGHEIVGVVNAIGNAVTKYTLGDIVGVGVYVDSCRNCNECKSDLQNYCTGIVPTYGGIFKHDHCVEKGNISYGGYSTYVVVDENYVLRIPKNLDLERVAPLLCAGITTYSPMMHFKLQPNQKLIVAGLGGLGHMAVKFGVALGAHVTVMSRGTSKKESALALGAHDYLDSTDEEAMKNALTKFDMMLDTISSEHNISSYMSVLKVNGVYVVLGLPTVLEVLPMSLIAFRRTLAGTKVGGIHEIQEMLDFCGKHNITSDVEVIRAKDINVAYKRILSSDVRYRFVVDAKSFNEDR